MARQPKRTNHDADGVCIVGPTRVVRRHNRYRVPALQTRHRPHFR